jgi:hypothetical protein
MGSGMVRSNEVYAGGMTGGPSVPTNFGKSKPDYWYQITGRQLN